MIKLSDYVFKFLKDKGVKHVFMLPGGGAMHLCDSLGTSGIEYIPFLHEQGASIAAEAYGQHTNTPGVCLVTSGPGGTNAITAVTAGWIDSTPMFIISGQAKRSDLVGDKGVRQIGSQEVQIVPMITPVTKYAMQVLEPTEIRYHLEKAWHEATSGRPGPVWLDIPLDVQGCQIDEDNLKVYEPKDTGSHSDISKAVDQTIELLSQSKKPLILAGNGIKLSGACDQFDKLIRTLGIPVQTTWKTIDMLDESDALYVGHPGIMGDRGANLIIQEADLLLSIGSRLDTSITAFNDEHFAFNAKKVIIDIDQNELNRMSIPDSVKVCCDAGDFIDELTYMLSTKTNSTHLWWHEWLEYCKDIRGKYPVITKKHGEESDRVSAYHFIDVLCDNLNEDDIIVPESSGGAGEITYQAFRLKKGQKMKNAAGLGSMGFGLPYAIGSCIANNRRRTILINGDGAFQLNIQELETLHRLSLPLKIFIWCNDGYASIRSMQRNNFEGRYVGSDEYSGHTMPDICRVAEAYGFEVCQIQSNGELDKTLPKIMLDDKWVICVLVVDPNETVSPRVKAYIGADGKMKSGLLEEMWPRMNDF
ncbi:MAG: thiamine pyrophosphate-binding protein [Lachnospiraceae bacterium]|nr:thiamine pyrophosphate-binding protein [Lachnospiraceae bacterium]